MPALRRTQRDRVLWLYLTRELKLHERAWRVLHIHPSAALKRRLETLPALHYVSALEPGAGPDGRFDLIVSDRLPPADALENLHEALKEHGYAVFAARTSDPDGLRAHGFTVLLDHYDQTVPDAHVLPQEGADLTICLRAPAEH